MVRQINSIPNEIADMTTSTRPISIDFRNVIARFAKPYDVYTDPATGALTIDNLRAAAYRGIYTKNDCTFISEIIEKFVNEIKDPEFKEFAQKELEKMDKANDAQIKNACDNIVARYDLLTRLDDKKFPPYGILNWNGQYQYITKCGAMPEDAAKTRNVKRMNDDVAFYLIHSEKVSMMDVEMYNKDIPNENKYRAFIREASVNTPDVNVSYVPERGVDVFISEDKQAHYIQLQNMRMDDFKVNPVGTIKRAIKDVELSKDEKDKIGKFLNNLADEINYFNKVMDYRKLDPPQEYTREDFAKDKKIAAMRINDMGLKMGRAE